MTNLQKWLRTIAWLRREFPAQRNVYVRTKKLKDDDGFTRFWRSFFIDIHPNRSLSIKLDSLLHEWAHVLTWFGAEKEEEHSGEWGLCHAKILTAFKKWDSWERK